MKCITRLINRLTRKSKKPKKLDCLIDCEFQPMGTVYHYNGGAATKMICEHGTQIYETKHLPDPEDAA